MRSLHEYLKHSYTTRKNLIIIKKFPTFSAFRAFPPEFSVFTSTILNLTCESSEEPVILKEVKVRPNSNYDSYVYEEENGDNNDNVNSNSVEYIEETVEKNENKLHVANYIEMNPIPGTFGEFQCISEKDKKVLHSWSYRILGDCVFCKIQPSCCFHSHLFYCNVLCREKRRKAEWNKV
jgi:hypothetical protein